MNIVYRTMLSLGLIGGYLKPHRISCGGKIGWQRKRNGDFSLGEAFDFCCRIHTRIQHHGFAIVDQLHPQEAIARHTIEVFHVEKSIHLSTLLSIASESRLRHQLEADFL